MRPSPPKSNINQQTIARSDGWPEKVSDFATLLASCWPIFDLFEVQNPAGLPKAGAKLCGLIDNSSIGFNFFEKIFKFQDLGQNRVPSAAMRAAQHIRQKTAPIKLASKRN